MLCLLYMEEEGLDNVNVWLERHNVPLKRATCNDKTSQNIKMQVGENTKLDGNAISIRELQWRKQNTKRWITNQCHMARLW
jgi:fructose-1-phosphate kinase PfkB-like protein